MENVVDMLRWIYFGREKREEMEEEERKKERQTGEQEAVVDVSSLSVSESSKVTERLKTLS